MRRSGLLTSSRPPVPSVKYGSIHRIRKAELVCTCGITRISGPTLPFLVRNCAIRSTRLTRPLEAGFRNDCRFPAYRRRIGVLRSGQQSPLLAAYGARTTTSAGVPLAASICARSVSSNLSAVAGSISPSITTCQPGSSPEKAIWAPSTSILKSPHPSLWRAFHPRGRRTSGRRLRWIGIQPDPSAARIRYSRTAQA